MIQNNYYDIALNDLMYLEQVALKTTFYNQITVQCQQTAEKFLKHIVESYCVQAPREEVLECLKTHNMRKLIRFIQEQLPEFEINSRKVIGLQGYYYETRCPGDNFFTATSEDVEVCYEALQEVKCAVDIFLKRNTKKED